MSITGASSAEWRRAVLAERAARLAERPALASGAERRALCLCEAGGELVGLPVDQILRVASYVGAAPLARAEPALLGITSHGGNVALVYDLATLLTGTAPERDAGGHVVLLRRRSPFVGLKVARTIFVADIELLTAEEAVNLAARPGVEAHGRHDDGRVVSIIDITALIDNGARAQARG